VTAETESAQVGSIGRKAGRGLRWTVLGTLATKMGSFAVSLVLARLLAPADFGLYAVALAATQFVMHVNDCGMIAAAVQWRGRFEDMAPTARTLALLFSAAWYAVFWAVAPAFASLAGSAQATGVVRLLTAVILVDGITAVSVASLQRRFQQDRLMAAIAAGLAVNAAFAIILAVRGAGAYSFAGGQVAGSVVTGVLMLLLARVPVRYGMDRAVAARLVRFGVPLAASLGVESVLLNADYVIVGNVLGATTLGFYLLAFNVSSWVPGLVGTAVRYVSVAGFSRLAEQKPDSLSLGVQRSVPLMVAGVLPIAVAMAVLAPQLVVFLYGAAWAPAAAVLRFLTILMVVRLLTALAFDILTSLGATRATVWLNLGWAAALVPALLIGAHAGGIRGVAIGHAIVAILVAMPLAVLALHRSGVRLWPVVPELLRPALGAACSAAVTVLVADVVRGPLFVQLGLAGGAGLLVYLLVAMRPQQIRTLIRAKATMQENK
jgi:PST family polysaccharide transporter